MDGKRPQPSWRPGQVKQSGIGGYSALPALHQLRRDCRAERFSVALPTSWVLFIQKFARRSQGTKTFDLNQNFEPRARNRRLRTVGAALMRQAVCPMILTAWTRWRRLALEPR